MLIVSQLLLAGLFGSMLFFSFVMAPLVFVKLEAETAGRFIRALFPWYYLVVLVLSALAGITLIGFAPLEAGVMWGVTSLAVFTRQILMLKINELRDESNAGNEVAEKRFNQLHRLSVVINFVQLAAVTLVLVRIAAA